ncbi:MAG: phosphotransferase [Gammaproteobacteria bacterium]|nr:phosphotransferase [Gammaproteobacteria bacterium]
MNHTTDQRTQLLQDWLNSLFDIVEDSFSVVSGDASFRRYFRFIAKNEMGQKKISLIAVDAPPELEDSQRFIDIALLLADNNLPAPKIYISSNDGFYVQQDFGDQLLNSALNENSADFLYSIAMNYIVDLQQIDGSNLPCYNSQLLLTEMRLFSDWFLAKHLSYTLTDKDKNILDSTYQLLESNALEQPQVFVHRDYHSRNLMVLDDDHLGIIDFQDAVLGPITYDLVSLLRDCYIEWPQHKIDSWVRQFVNILPGQYDIAQFYRWFDLMGMQRHLKAIGIFSRLNYRDGKTSYMNDIPRTINYVLTVSDKYDELKPFHTFVRKLL